MLLIYSFPVAFPVFHSYKDIHFRNIYAHINKSFFVEKKMKGSLEKCKLNYILLLKFFIILIFILIVMLLVLWVAAHGPRKEYVQ